MKKSIILFKNHIVKNTKRDKLSENHFLKIFNHQVKIGSLNFNNRDWRYQINVEHIFKHDLVINKYKTPEFFLSDLDPTSNKITVIKKLKIPEFNLNNSEFLIDELKNTEEELLKLFDTKRRKISRLEILSENTEFLRWTYNKEIQDCETFFKKMKYFKRKLKSRKNRSKKEIYRIDRINLTHRYKQFISELTEHQLELKTLKETAEWAEYNLFIEKLALEFIKDKIEAFKYYRQSLINRLNLLNIYVQKTQNSILLEYKLKKEYLIVTKFELEIEERIEAKKRKMEIVTEKLLCSIQEKEKVSREKALMILNKYLKYNLFYIFKNPKYDEFISPFINLLMNYIFMNINDLEKIISPKRDLRDVFLEKVAKDRILENLKEKKALEWEIKHQISLKRFRKTSWIRVVDFSTFKKKIEIRRWCLTSSMIIYFLVSLQTLEALSKISEYSLNFPQFNIDDIKKWFW